MSIHVLARVNLEIVHRKQHIYRHPNLEKITIADEFYVAT